MDLPKTDYFYSTYQRQLGAWLILLLGLFAVRVIIQLQLAINPVTNFSEFDEWHSATMSYPILLGSQVLILVSGWVYVWRLFTSRVAQRPQLGIVLYTLGWLYWSVMLVRLILGLTLYRDVHWFAQEIPALFHLLLANMLMLVGNFHRQPRVDL